MSERRTSNYEETCLLELLSALINHRKLPDWRWQPDWGGVYKIADYHNVANDVYYMTMGMNIRSLMPWKKKFEERFHMAVQSEERYQVTVEEVQRELEFEKIHCMVLKDYNMRRYYPRMEMRALDAVEILIEKGKKKELDRAMYALDFSVEETRLTDGYRYYKIPGIHLVIKEELAFTNKKMKGHFARSPRAYRRKSGYLYVHEQNTEEFYLYVMSCYAESYARGRLEIRELMDFWYYYLQVYMTVDWKYVTEVLDRLKLTNFADCLVKLAAAWFGEMTFPNEKRIFYAMEEYIISKGMRKRKESAALLPLVKEVLDFYKRDLRKERRLRKLHWMFPQMEYMEVLFPFLKNHPVLLWLTWILRLFRSSYFTVKNFLWDKKVRVQNFIKKLKKKWCIFWEPKVNACKRKLKSFWQKLKILAGKCKRKRKKRGSKKKADTET